jgi:hypothetical protein
MRRGLTSRAAGVGFFRIPADPRRRSAWIKAISRQNWEPKSWTVICGRHFVDGFPSDDPEDVDYRPTINLKAVCGATAKRRQATKKDDAMKDVAEVTCHFLKLR